VDRAEGRVAFTEVHNTLKKPDYLVIMENITLLLNYYTTTTTTILYTTTTTTTTTPKRSFKDRVRRGLGMDWVQVSVGLIVFNILLSVWLFRQLVFTVRSVINIQQAIGQMLMNSVQNGPAATALKGSDGKFTKIIDEVL